MENPKRTAPIISKSNHPITIVGPIAKPFPTPEIVREWYTSDNSERSLAKAYAVSHVIVSVTDDEVYDHEEGTEGYQNAITIADAWTSLEQELVQGIFSILKAEGVQIPEKGYIYSLIPFMERNGYRFADGWWIRSDT